MSFPAVLGGTSYEDFELARIICRDAWNPSTRFKNADDKLKEQHAHWTAMLKRCDDQTNDAAGIAERLTDGQQLGDAELEQITLMSSDERPQTLLHLMKQKMFGGMIFIFLRHFG